MGQDNIVPGAAEVIDQRNRSFLWVDKTIISQFLPKVGVSALCVYMGLLYYENSKTRQCFPSAGTLSKLLGVSVNTVRSGIKSLKDAGLIAVDVRRNPESQFTSCLFTILDVAANFGGGTPKFEVGGTPKFEEGVPQNLTSNNTKTNKTKKAEQKGSDFVLPGWVPQEAWAGFEEMRKKLKKPLTERAKELAIGRLAKLKLAGHDPGAVIDQSVMNGWHGLFEIRENGNNGKFRNKAEVRDHHNSGVLDNFVERKDSGEVVSNLFRELPAGNR